MTAKDLGYKSSPTMPFLGDPSKPYAFMIVVPAPPGGEHHH
jgi:hypothetical protein